MSNIKRLSVHKNNKEQREQKELRREAAYEAKNCVSGQGIKGYATVAYYDDGSYKLAFSVDNEILQSHQLSDYVKKTLDKEINKL
jgi:hypothetical protein